jgi:hypothetical protein
VPVVDPPELKSLAIVTFELVERPAFTPLPPLPKPVVEDPGRVEFADFTGKTIATLDEYWTFVVMASTTVRLLPLGGTEARVLHFPARITFANFQKFAEWAVGDAVDPDKDTFLMYRSDSLSEPFLEKHYTLMHGITTLYYRIIAGVSREVWAISREITAEFSADARTIEKTTTLILPKEATYSDLKAKLIEIGFFGESANERLRVAAVRDSRMWQVPVLRQMIHVGFSVVRFEIVPEDQRDLGHDSKLLEVAMAVVAPTEYLKATGVPFFIKIARETILADIKEPVFEIFGIADDLRKKSKFYGGGEWVRFTRKTALSDEDSIWRDQGAFMLYVVPEPKKPPNPYGKKEKALHIDN